MDNGLFDGTNLVPAEDQFHDSKILSHVEPASTFGACPSARIWRLYL